MPTIRYRQPGATRSAQKVNAPDRIFDPFTVPPLDDHSREHERYRIIDHPLMGPEGFIAYKPENRAVAEMLLAPFKHITRNWQQATFRFTPAEQDVALDENSMRTSLEPEVSSGPSGITSTHSDVKCYRPSAISFDENSQEIARSVENPSGLTTAHELIVFPTTQATSITGLNDSELSALAELMQDRYNAFTQAEYPYVWFGMERGVDRGETEDNFHVEIFASQVPPRDHSAIWTNEDRTRLSHFQFQRQRGALTISADKARATETYAPYVSGNPLSMGVAFTGNLTPGPTPTGDQSKDLPLTYEHFSTMTNNQVVDWLKSVADSVAVLEALPANKRPNGLGGYSLSFVVPPAGKQHSPMTFFVNPAKVRSAPFEQTNGLENPINPFNARDILAPRFDAIAR